MFVIGITGGIGCGKSTAADYFRRRGVKVLDADEISREVTGKGGPAVKEIVDHFGPEIEAEPGVIDRRKLADLVFHDRKALDELSLIVHRYVIMSIQKAYKKELKKDTKLLVLDVPIPVEEGFLDISDQILVVWADDDVRLERLEARGMSQKEAKDRMAMQMSKDEYQALGTHMIDNSESLEALKEQLDQYTKEELEVRGLRLPETNEP